MARGFATAGHPSVNGAESNGPPPASNGAWCVLCRGGPVMAEVVTRRIATRRIVAAMAPDCSPRRDIWALARTYIFLERRPT